MSELIKLKNRIKAIETTEKVTKAMRLISMSQHAKLKRTATAIQKYDAELTNIFSSVKKLDPNWKCDFLNPEATGKKLIIVIGSQKGLCGTYNSQIFNFFNSKIKNHSNFNLIFIGKKACDFLSKKYSSIKEFPDLSINKVNSITKTLFNIIATASPKYENVTIFYNYPKSFLTQVPTEKQIIPVLESISDDTAKKEYIWEQPANQILDILAEEYLRFTLQTILKDALLAEQAARFKSMDSAAHNAENLLSEMKRQYSKQRQAKITKELIELTGAF